MKKLPLKDRTDCKHKKISAEYKF